MNPNDVMEQQQAIMNQMIRNAQHVQWEILAFSAAGLVITILVLYMFYARLRDIADELRKLRIAYEMIEDRKARDCTDKTK